MQAANVNIERRCLLHVLSVSYSVLNKKGNPHCARHPLLNCLKALVVRTHTRSHDRHMGTWEHTYTHTHTHRERERERERDRVCVWQKKALAHRASMPLIPWIG